MTFPGLAWLFAFYYGHRLLLSKAVLKCFDNYSQNWSIEISEKRAVSVAILSDLRSLAPVLEANKIQCRVSRLIEDRITIPESQMLTREFETIALFYEEMAQLVCN